MKNLLTIILFGILNYSKAQVVAELFSTKKYTSHEFWGELLLSDSSDFSFFSYNIFRINHNNNLENQLFNYSTINYHIINGFGVALGGFLTSTNFSPVFALNYSADNDTWLINIFPSIELKKKPNVELFAFLQYRPKISDQFRLFLQVIGSSNFIIRKHNFSEQNTRIGLDYKTFQFGFGLDTNQLTIEESSMRRTYINGFIGGFLRKEF